MKQTDLKNTTASLKSKTQNSSTIATFDSSQSIRYLLCFLLHLTSNILFFFWCFKYLLTFLAIRSMFLCLFPEKINSIFPRKLNLLLCLIALLLAIKFQKYYFFNVIMFDCSVIRSDFPYIM